METFDKKQQELQQQDKDMEPPAAMVENNDKNDKKADADVFVQPCASASFTSSPSLSEEADEEHGKDTTTSHKSAPSKAPYQRDPPSLLSKVHRWHLDHKSVAWKVYVALCSVALIALISSIVVQRRTSSSTSASDDTDDILFPSDRTNWDRTSSEAAFTTNITSNTTASLLPTPAPTPAPPPRVVIGPFQLQMMWSSKACWQDDCKTYLEWCMQCEGRECNKGDLLWVEPCQIFQDGSMIPQQLFTFWVVPSQVKKFNSSSTTDETVYPYGLLQTTTKADGGSSNSTSTSTSASLCLQREDIDDIAFSLQECDSTVTRQWFQGPPFNPGSLQQQQQQQQQGNAATTRTFGWDDDDKVTDSGPEKNKDDGDNKDKEDSQYGLDDDWNGLGDGKNDAPDNKDKDKEKDDFSWGDDDAVGTVQSTGVKWTLSKSTPFELYPYKAKGRDCISTDHHPRAYEAIISTNCNNDARQYKTNLWYMIFPPSPTDTYEDGLVIAKSANQDTKYSDSSLDQYVRSYYVLEGPRGNPFPACGPFGDTCGMCTGHCESSRDCAGDLECFQTSSTSDTVPGCSGTVKNGVNYCYALPGN